MIKQKISDDQIIALKNRDQEKLTVLRYILSQIKNKEIDSRGELSDEEVVAVLRKIAKELNESIEAFKTGKRQDLVEKNQKQLEILTNYLPEEITDADLQKEIEALIEKNKKLFEKNPKIIIGIAVKELKSKANPSRIIRTLQSKLKS